MDISKDVITILVGAAGGISGFLVSEKYGFRHGLSAAFVGSFSAYTFPPIVIYWIQALGYGAIDNDMALGISGVIGAASWQLMVIITTVVPDYIHNLLTKYKAKGDVDGKNKLSK